MSASFFGPVCRRGLFGFSVKARVRSGFKQLPLKNIRFLAFVLGAAFLFSAELPAQDSSPRPPVSRTDSPYLVPQTIFVGDPGRLVVPLGQAFAGAEPFVSETPGELPESPDLVIRRIELEHRAGVPRLLIDFVPYASGPLSFPPLALPSGGAEPLIVSGLEVPVASILGPSQTDLSEPVPPMAVPGTSFLVYGTAVLILLLLFAGIGGSLWGRHHFRELWERFRRRHLIRAMARFLRRLEHEGEHEKKGNPGYYLTLLSGEFREFLSFFTGVNCRSLTAGELLDLPLDYPGDRAELSAGEAAEDLSQPSFLTPVFLRDLFRDWDTLRFSGRSIDKIDLFLALEKTKKFIGDLDRAERARVLPMSLWGSASKKNEAAMSAPEAANGV